MFPSSLTAKPVVPLGKYDSSFVGSPPMARSSSRSKMNVPYSGSAGLRTTLIPFSAAIVPFHFIWGKLSPAAVIPKAVNKEKNQTVRLIFTYSSLFQSFNLDFSYHRSKPFDSSSPASASGVRNHRVSEKSNSSHFPTYVFLASASYSHFKRYTAISLKPFSFSSRL